ncbi:MAG: 50S ribosomal protein L19 [Dehalococcoidia bacterium]
MSNLIMSRKIDTSLYIKQINNLDEFQPGDTVSVNLRIIEGDKERIQTFDGNVISGRFTTSKIPGLGDTFTVRRISYGVGVERVLPFHSPNIESLKVTRKGKVRKSKLYYLRGLTGKKARIKEKRS